MMNVLTQSDLAVSVIIPTKCRHADLEAAVKSVLRQSYLPRELLIADQSLDDESRKCVQQAFAEAPASVRHAVSLNYIKDPGISGAAEARNRSMDVARGEVWLFLDDDVVLEADFIEELLKVYARCPGAAGVSGVVTNYKPYPWPFRLWNAVFVRGPFQDQRQAVYLNADRMREGEPIRIDRFTGAFMSFRAEAIRGFRFDSNLRGVSDGEDVDFCVRLGPRAILVMAPRARLAHYSSPRGRECSHWLQRDARSQHYLYRRNWNHGVRNRISFFWLNAGYVLAAALASARRLSTEPWRALRAGIREGKAAASTPPLQTTPAGTQVLESVDH